MTAFDFIEASLDSQDEENIGWIIVQLSYTYRVSSRYNPISYIQSGGLLSLSTDEFISYLGGGVSRSTYKIGWYPNSRLLGEFMI